MPQLSRVGDSINSTGGVITGPGAITSFANSEIVSVVGDTISPHPAAPFGIGIHTGATVIQGSSTVKTAGQPVTYNGSACSCGHMVNQGSLNVNVSE